MLLGFFKKPKKVKNISWNGILVVKKKLIFLLLYCHKKIRSDFVNDTYVLLNNEMNGCHVNDDLNCLNINI